MKVKRHMIEKYMKRIEEVAKGPAEEREKAYLQMHRSSPKTFFKARLRILNKYKDHFTKEET